MELSARKHRAVMALVEYGSVARAAEESGITRQSLYRWLREPEFAQALREASSAQLIEASRRLTALMDKAITELERLLCSESEHQRRLAVEMVLSHGVRLRELTELELRIQNLEMRVGVVR